LVKKRADFSKGAKGDAFLRLEVQSPDGETLLAKKRFISLRELGVKGE